VLTSIVVDGDALRSHPAIDESTQVMSRERLETKESGPAAQRCVDFEERVLRGGTDEHDGAVLDGRQQRILLGLVEAMDLVDEHDGPPAVLTEVVLGRGRDLANVLHSRRDGGEAHEPGPRGGGDHFGESGLARSRWTPQDHRGEPIVLDERAQRCTTGDEMLLAHHVVERTRSQTRREGSLSTQLFDGARTEQVAVRHPLLFLLGGGWKNPDAEFGQLGGVHRRG
jgi:hypothetical protein